jgi:hypothetical protein
MTRAGIVVAGADEVVEARRVAKSAGAEEAVPLFPLWTEIVIAV